MWKALAFGIAALICYFLEFYLHDLANMQRLAHLKGGDRPDWYITAFGILTLFGTIGFAIGCVMSIVNSNRG